MHHDAALLARSTATERAAQSGGRATALSPEATGVLHAQGLEALQRDDFPRALELLARVVVQKPSHAPYHVDLAAAYRKQGKFNHAVGCCRTALLLKPQFTRAWEALGLAYQAQGRHADAVSQFRHALELQPDAASTFHALGTSLQAFGDHDAASAHLRRAVELQPEWFWYQRDLGFALLEQDKAEDALPHLQQAARLRPEAALVWHRLGNAWRALECYDEARAAYRLALKASPAMAVSQVQISTTFRSEGKFDEALLWGREALANDPHDPYAWEQLAQLHDDRDEPDEALACWRKALEVAPTPRASSHIGLGNALQDLGLIAEARGHFEIAARVEPEAAEGPLCLGTHHEQLGEFTVAEMHFREALRRQPDFANAHSRLATMLRGKLAATDLDALKTRLDDPSLQERPRARLLFALAHVQDSLGDYTGAAASLREANALAREYVRENREYSPSDHQRFVSKLIRQTSAEFFSRHAGAGSDSRRPVFIVGLPRSGTTLVEQILASHPQVHGAGELRLALRSFQAIPGALGLTEPPIDCIGRLDEAAVGRIAEVHLERLRRCDDGRAARVVDKMPDNYLHLGLLVTLFPHATLIHCRRDLRDVAVSCWMTDFAKIRWANAPAHLAARFREHQRMTEHWRSVLPIPVHEVNYADTVEDVEAVARRLLDACGLEWHPSCLEFYKSARPVRTASLTQVRQPIYRQSVARWKHYEQELAELFDALPSCADSV